MDLFGDMVEILNSVVCGMLRGKLVCIWPLSITQKLFETIKFTLPKRSILPI